MRRRKKTTPFQRAAHFQKAAQRKQRRGPLAGFTLLELMLSLSLTVLVMIAVGMAINLNLRSLDKRRNQVEEAQLARAVFRMMSDDLRNSIRYQEIDFSAAQKMAQSMADASAALQSAANGITTTSSTGGNNNNKSSGGNSSGGNSGNNKSGSGSTGNQSGGSQSGGQGSGSNNQSGGNNNSNNKSGSTSGSGGGQSSGSRSGSGSTTSTTNSGSGSSKSSGGTTQTVAEVPANVPGLYGTQYELQVDVSRLPRVDEYGPLATANSQFDTPSDVKSVTYFVKPGDAEMDPNAAPLAHTQHVSNGSGLARRSISRLTGKWAMDNGNYSSLENVGEIIAPEVTNVEFRYFDGTEWASEWNSDDRGAFPVAVEILLAIKPLQEPRPGDPAQLTYRLVVKLPAGSPSTLEATTTTTDTQSGATSGATGTGATGAAGS